MLEPMSARLASSFSRKGISAADTDTICDGEMSIMVNSSRGVMDTSPPRERAVTRLFSKAPFSPRGALAWAMTSLNSWEASR